MSNHSVILTSVSHWCFFFNKKMCFSTRSDLCFGLIVPHPSSFQPPFQPLFMLPICNNQNHRSNARNPFSKHKTSPFSLWFIGLFCLFLYIYICSCTQIYRYTLLLQRFSRKRFKLYYILLMTSICMYHESITGNIGIGY